MQYGCARQLDSQSHIAHLHTASIEANLLTNLPAFLQAQLSAFNYPSFLSISTARLQSQHAFQAWVEAAQRTILREATHSNPC